MDEKQKSNRGGARPGSGPKASTPALIALQAAGEEKTNITLRSYPSQTKFLISKFGSVQAAYDSLYNPV